MSNYNENDNRSASSAAEQFEQSTGDGEQGYTIAAPRKPINRNLVVLLLIVAVGTSLVYLMYLRSRFDADRQTPEQIQASEAVTSFMKEGVGSITQMQEQLSRTERQVATFQQDNSDGQIAAEDLKINPFSFGDPKTAVAAVTVGQPKADGPDPADAVRLAVSKTKIQMILYSASNSSVTINNWVYKTGDRIVIDTIAFKVKSISASKVVLSHPMSDFVIETPGSAGM